MLFRDDCAQPTARFARAMLARPRDHGGASLLSLHSRIIRAHIAAGAATDPHDRMAKQSSDTFIFLVAAVAVLALTVLAYGPGMSAGFYFDDLPNFARAPALQWTDLSVEALQRTLNEAWMPSRPVANVSLALTHLFAGTDPGPYHWTNLLLHVVAGLSLFWVIRLIQWQHTRQAGDRWLALLAVFLFLVHPLNIQAVTYVVQRMTSMATLFFLLGFGSYLAGRYRAEAGTRHRWFLLAGACCLLSIGCKEIGYLLPPLVLLFEYCLHKEDWRNWAGNRATHSVRRILISAAAVAVALFAAVIWYRYGGHLDWFSTMPRRDFSGYERVLTQARVQFFYLSLLLWPATSRLTLEHEFVVSRGLLDPVTTALALGGLLLIAIWALRNASSRPLLAFPPLAYFLLHSMESAPINLEIVFEHRMYLPMTMLMLGLATNLGSLANRYARGIYPALAVIGLVLATATYERNEVWREPLAFLRDTAQKSPGKWRPQYNLGSALGQQGMLVEARVALEKALRIRPDDSETHNQLANVFMRARQYRAAERHYRLAVEHDAENAEALYNLSMLLRSEGRFEEQRHFLEQFVRHAPPYLERQKQQAVRYLGRRPAVDDESRQ